jgi:hypothetical protein
MFSSRHACVSVALYGCLPQAKNEVNPIHLGLNLLLSIDITQSAANNVFMIAGYFCCCFTLLPPRPFKYNARITITDNSTIMLTYDLCTPA